MKKCTICNIDKDKTAFSKHSRNIDGIRSICKKCVSLDSKEYYERNKERIKNKSKQFYIDNKEDVLVSQKKYYNDTKEDRYKTTRKWATNNKDKVKKYKKKWDLNNKGLKNSFTAKRRTSKKKPAQNGYLSSSYWR